jgi:ankyrin repeat protein
MRYGVHWLSMASTLTVDESKAFLAFCRGGRLYDVERWIAAGRSIVTHPSIKRTPLLTAIDTGFHSLVELLARNEARQEEKDRTLVEAVERKRLDLVQMLVENGARIQAIALEDVLLTWDRALMQFFLDRGADPVTGNPFMVAFQNRVQRALRPFVDYKKAHPEVADALQVQVDRALRHFAYQADLKWISLLMWAGANPRSLGPDLNDRYADDPECHTTALREACSKGNIDAIKKLKPDPRLDNLSDLLQAAALADSRELIDYLLHLGAQPNDKPNGGSSALDRCLWHLPWEDRNTFTSKQLASKYALSGGFARIERLLGAGAQWRPSEPDGMKSVRQMLCKCEPAVTVTLMKMFAKYKAAPEELLEELLDTPRMRGHLSTIGMKL